MEGKGSIPSISSIFKHVDYRPSSVGYLSEFLQGYRRCVPSTLSMAQQTVVFYLSWVGDQFHECQDLFNCCHQLERKAYGTMSQEIKAAETFANAKSEGQSAKAS